MVRVNVRVGLGPPHYTHSATRLGSKVPHILKHNLNYAYRVMVLSQWPHVAEQVRQQVAELVSKCETTGIQVRQLDAESSHTSHMCGNKTPCPGGLADSDDQRRPLANGSDMHM